MLAAFLAPIRKQRSSFANGFSLVELVVVLAGISILAGLAIPNVLKWNKLSQVDEAKGLLNAAASECLQRLRTNPDDYLSWTPSAIKALGSDDSSGLPGKYQYKDGLKTCEEIYIHDPSDDSSLLMDMTVSVIDGKIVKEAVNKHPDTERACNSWGNCGGSESAKWLKACLKKKGTCDASLTAGLQGSDGPISANAWKGSCTWPIPTPNCVKEDCCSEPVWSCKGAQKMSQESYDACKAALLGEKCKGYLQKLEDDKHHGATPGSYMAECGEDFCGYYYQGKCVGDEDGFNVERAKQASAVCQSATDTFTLAQNDGILWSDSNPNPGTCDYLALCGCSSSKGCTKHYSQATYDADEVCIPPVDCCTDKGEGWCSPNQYGNYFCYPGCSTTPGAKGEVGTSNCPWPE